MVEDGFIIFIFYHLWKLINILKNKKIVYVIFIFGLIIQCLDQNIVFNHLNEKLIVDEILMILMLNYIQEKNNF